MRKRFWIIAKLDPINGLTLSHAFARQNNADLFARCYGGTVKQIETAEDEKDDLTAAQLGKPYAD